MTTFVVGLTFGLIIGTLLGLVLAGMAQARAEQRDSELDGVGLALTAAGRFLQDERITSLIETGDLPKAQKLMLHEIEQQRRNGDQP